MEQQFSPAQNLMEFILEFKAGNISEGTMIAMIENVFNKGVNEDAQSLLEWLFTYDWISTHGPKEQRFKWFEKRCDPTEKYEIMIAYFRDAQKKGEVD